MPSLCLTAILICIHHTNPTPHTHPGETVADSIENCCKLAGSGCRFFSSQAENLSVGKSDRSYVNLPLKLFLLARIAFNKSIAVNTYE